MNPRRLWLIRHGEAVSEEFDPERLLTPAGRIQVEAVARVLARLDVRPAAVFHSNKLRARQTAELVGGALRPAPPVREAAHLTPNAHPDQWADRLDRGEEDLVLVGHLPHLVRLVCALAGLPDFPELVRLEPAGAICVSRPAPGQRWSVEWILPPAVAGTLTG